MIINEKPELNKDVRLHVLLKKTLKMSSCAAKWDGESWKIHTPLGYAPVPISLEVLGWEEK